MKAFVKIRVWCAAHPKWLNLLRIVLGLVLIWKGIFFILNLGLLDLFLKDSGMDDALGVSIYIHLLAQLIIILNLFGGFCVTFNLSTKLFCLLNLPVLFGAVFVVNMQRGEFRPHAEFWFSLFSLLSIITILITPENEVVVDNKKPEKPLSEVS